MPNFDEPPTHQYIVGSQIQTEPTYLGMKKENIGYITSATHV